MRDKLQQISKLAAEWAAQGGADTLERDLALELLREVYAEIKFGPQSLQNPQKEGPRPAPQLAPQPAPQPAEQQTNIKPEALDEPAKVIGIKEFEPLRKISPEEFFEAAEPSKSEEPEEPEYLAETTEPAESEEPLEEHLKEPTLMPRPIAPEIIRSLYGEGTAAPTLGDTLGAGRQTLGDVLERKDV